MVQHLNEGLNVEETNKALKEMAEAVKALREKAFEVKRDFEGMKNKIDQEISELRDSTDIAYDEIQGIESRLKDMSLTDDERYSLELDLDAAMTVYDEDYGTLYGTESNPGLEDLQSYCEGFIDELSSFLDSAGDED